ncbi:MAG: hypothetical protein ACKV2O_22620 [Acidimicrobiales bacterium]
MSNRRKQLMIGAGAAALAVALIVALVIWRSAGNGPDGGQIAGPDSTPPATADSADTTTPTTVKPYTKDPPVAEPPAPIIRDPLTWPFAGTSIWNTPLGASAQLVPASMSLGRGGVTADENILIFEPGAPPVDVLFHEGAWDANKIRCQEVTSQRLAGGWPVPPDFVTDPGYLGATPNHAAAVLLADGDTLVQTQPLHRCSAGGPLISQYLFEQDSLRNGNGIAGAHGGSRMSSVGGTIRLGELVPGGALHHALKLNIDCQAFCSYDQSDPDGKAGFRWPAGAADGEAPTRYQGKVPQLQMGALLALPATFDVAALQTEPARMVARAMQRYGAYVVDDTHYPSFALTTEWSPDGRVVDEFQAAWGFPMQIGVDPADCPDGGAACAWTQDLALMIAALTVVDDNSAAAIGGAGTRLSTCAPPYADGSGAGPCPSS